MKKLLENWMALIIAQRLSTIRLCDETLVLYQGRVVEKGSHSELMAKSGLYNSLYRLLFKEEEGLCIAQS